MRRPALNLRPCLTVLLLATPRLLTPGAAAGVAASRSSSSGAYAFRPLDPFAVPSVAIIGTAKAGTTDLYTLLMRTSRATPDAARKRVKEVKLLAEQDRDVRPGRPDWAEYLRRVGHPCARAAATAGAAAAASALRACVAAAINSSAADGAGGAPASLPPITVDASPLYLAYPHAADALRGISANSKVIVLLRDPLDRAESMYNHRVHTEASGHLPPRVRNRTVSEWGERFLAWVDAAPRVPGLLQRLAAARRPAAQAALYRQLVAAGLPGQPPGEPLTFAGLNRRGAVERNLFGTALYAGALAAWRAAYFAPGRVMIIDAHRYFARRGPVLQQVFEFIYGRPMRPGEAAVAARTAVQNARRAAGIRFAGAQLEPRVAAGLRDFYAPFDRLLLDSVLPGLAADGAWVVGFDGAPWNASRRVQGAAAA